MGRSFAAFTLWTGDTDGLKRKRRPPTFPICTVPPGPPPPDGEVPHHRSSKARSFRATSRESTAGRARGPACGFQPSGAGDNVLEDEHRATQKDSKRWFAGDQRFSEGVAERRGADLSVTQTFTTGLSRQHPLDHSQQNQDGQPLGSTVSVSSLNAFPTVSVPSQGLLMDQDVCHSFYGTKVFYADP